MNKYSHISSIEELEEAQRQLRRKIKSKGAEVKIQAEFVRDFYTPKNILFNGARSVSNSLPLNSLLLFGVRLLKKKVLNW